MFYVHDNVGFSLEQEFRRSDGKGLIFVCHKIISLIFMQDRISADFGVI